MSTEKKIGNGTLKVIKDDITLLEIEAFVFYAQADLKLGTGYGNAIAMRGGPKIQEELNEIGKANVTEVVVTTGGKLKAKNILHAVGPAFQEEDMQAKLIKTTENILKKAEEQNFEQVAIGALGAGFYGVPLADSARIVLETVSQHLKNDSKLKEIVICLNDGREYRAFESTFNALN